MFLEKKDSLHDCLVSNYVFESLHPPQLRHAGLLQFHVIISPADIPDSEWDYVS